ncbi:MAG TPA: CHAT domain-containing protein [Methylomirabilota bacterium]|jgi:class 3 adenylate cyclase/TolB-like protein|nr:CHAT domain-containing protein [Methylomirabilota bacterium]
MGYESETQVDEKLLLGLLGQIERLATPREPSKTRNGTPTYGEPNVTMRRLQSIGEQIFTQLLPEQARTFLRTADPADLFLHLDEQLIHVPWELCHDGVDFFATKFPMGRYVYVPRSIPSPSREPVEPERLKVLLIADPTESLPQAVQEAEQLCRILDGVEKVKVTLLGGRLVSKAEVLTELQAHDVVHFAGHSHYDPVQPQHSGWHLQEGVLTAEELRSLSRPPLLVFSNSCQAGATTAWGGRYRYDGEAFGIGSAFLVAGVRNYIGAFWVVHDEESRDFAVVFYKGLASGLTLGEALRQARLEIRSQKGGERLTWASYMLYGDPAVTFFSEQEIKLISSSAKTVARKLVAILHADVKGYSRRIGEDEESTIQTLNAHRAVMHKWLRQHSGEVIGTPAGDDLLALFSSAVEAVQCAVQIQRELQQKNAQLPANRRIEFRIAVNLGEVSLQGGNVHGDGVNFAALLQHEVAEPGGICISEVVYDQIKNRPGLAQSCEDLGIKYFEKMQRSARVYRVHLEPGAFLPQDKRGEKEGAHSLAKRWRRLTALSFLVLFGGIAVAVLVVSILPPRPVDPCQGSQRSRTKAIIVRAFDMLKVDPDHIWLKEAIPRRLSSELSRAEGLRVYPSEHFDWLLQQCHLSDIELARRLGIFKVIRGSFVAVGMTLHIESHPEDVERPVIEPPEEKEGKLDDFFRLMQELAAQIIIRLDLKTPEVTERKAPPPDTFRLMLEGEGEVPATSPQQKTPPSDVQPAESKPETPGPLSLRWLEVSAAWADEDLSRSRTPEDEVRQVLERYRQAYEKKNLTLLEDVYETVTPAQREANEKYFQQAQNLTVNLNDVEIAVHGNEAVASYTREDRFVDAQTGQRVNLDARFTKILVRTDAGWRISMGKK